MGFVLANVSLSVKTFQSQELLAGGFEKNVRNGKRKTPRGRQIRGIRLLRELSKEV